MTVRSDRSLGGRKGPLVGTADADSIASPGLTEDEVVKTVVPRETADGAFTAAADVTEVAVFFAAFPSLALTGQSLVVSHGWHMQ